MKNRAMKNLQCSTDMSVSAAALLSADSPRAPAEQTLKCRHDSLTHVTAERSPRTRPFKVVRRRKGEGNSQEGGRDGGDAGAAALADAGGRLHKHGARRGTEQRANYDRGAIGAEGKHGAVPRLVLLDKARHVQVDEVGHGEEGACALVRVLCQLCCVPSHPATSGTEFPTLGGGRPARPVQAGNECLNCNASNCHLIKIGGISLANGSHQKHDGRNLAFVRPKAITCCVQEVYV